MEVAHDFLLFSASRLRHYITRAGNTEEIVRLWVPPAVLSLYMQRLALVTCQSDGAVG